MLSVFFRIAQYFEALSMWNINEKYQDNLVDAGYEKEKAFDKASMVIYLAIKVIPDSLEQHLACCLTVV